MMILEDVFGVVLMVMTVVLLMYVLMTTRPGSSQEPEPRGTVERQEKAIAEQKGWQVQHRAVETRKKPLDGGAMKIAEKPNTPTETPKIHRTEGNVQLVVKKEEPPKSEDQRGGGAEVSEGKDVDLATGISELKEVLELLRELNEEAGALRSLVLRRYGIRRSET